MQIIKARLKEIKGLTLMNGGHPIDNLEKEMCVMEMVAYVAGEPWSANPKCACPVLTGYAISVNDNVDEATRQKLKPLIRKLVESKSTKAVEKKRAEFLVHHSITKVLPLLTDMLKLKSVSARLRKFKIGQWKEAETYINGQKEVIRESAKKFHAAANAAANAATYTAANAASAAASAAAYAATYAAANAAYAAANAAASDKKSEARWLKLSKAIGKTQIEALTKACAIKKAA